MQNRVELHKALKEQKKARKKQKKFTKKFTNEFIRVADGLDVIAEWIVRFNVDGANSLDISVAGDHNTFKGMWAALRKLGYGTSSRPTEDKFSSWTGWWYNHDQDEQLPIYVSFSSTKCTRRKIGTKMVERDVYETVCE